MEQPHEHQPSTSASTIRGLRHIDPVLIADAASAHEAHYGTHSPFRPSSPHSAYHSEPGSPSGDSVSSFPSVGSSFLFSSGPTSPPHPPHHPEDEDNLGDSTSGLVIPSLTLPAPSRRPTAFGQTLGDVRLLLLGPKDADVSAVASQLVDDNEDVVEVGLWEEDRIATRGKRKAVLRVSTDWVEHRDRHGLERVEPSKNVELVELPPYDPHSEAENSVERILPVVHSPFREIMDILSQDHPPNGTLAHILSSSCSPLYTALILLAPTSLSLVERTLIESLSSHVPIILLPSSTPSSSTRDHTRRPSASHLSSFRPSSIDALRTGLFRSPNTLATLRSEAASRFLRWREVERAVERVQWSAGTLQTPAPPHPRPSQRAEPDLDKAVRWDKQAWEAQWEGSLSQEAALHMRRRRGPSPLSSSSFSTLTLGKRSATFSASVADRDRDTDGGRCASAPFDPLHLPSLFVFSFSLLGALRARVARTLGLSSADVVRVERGLGQDQGRARVRTGGVGYALGLGFALVSAFCAGVGIGLVAAARF